MLTYWPARSDFERMASRANTVPLYTQLLSDQLTPVSAFNRMAADADHAFLLESVIGGEKVARYSFIAVDPTVVFEATGTDYVVTPTDGPPQASATADPLAALEDLLRSYRAHHLPELPRFVGGRSGTRRTTRPATTSICRRRRRTTAGCPTCFSASTIR